MPATPTRDEAWELVTSMTQSEQLRRHMLSVEAAMRAYARRFGEDEERWAVLGLIHAGREWLLPDDVDRVLVWTLAFVPACTPVAVFEICTPSREAAPKPGYTMLTPASPISPTTLLRTVAMANAGLFRSIPF